MVMPEGEPLEFIYRNHRGEVSKRQMIPRALVWGATEWHPEPQWLIRGWDIEKDAVRHYALNDMSGKNVRRFVDYVEEDCEW